MVIPGHNLGNSQVIVNRTIGPTLVSQCDRFCLVSLTPSQNFLSVNRVNMEYRNFIVFWGCKSIPVANMDKQHMDRV